MKIRFPITAASGALLLAGAATAQGQSQQSSDVLGQLLGAVFGTSQQATEQTLNTDWSQGGRPFTERRAQLDARIDVAVRDGSLSRSEADQIRRDYNDIVRLEAQYSANGGMSQQQRDDLRTRYRTLTQRVGGQGYAQGGNQDAPWQPLSTRSIGFEQRVNAGLQTRDLSQMEARQLRYDWRSLGQVEANYLRGGLNAREQADLWDRYNAIDSRLGGGTGNEGMVQWTQLERRLVTAERNGSIGRTVAMHMRAQLTDLTRLDAAYAEGGYSADQRMYLTQRHEELDEILAGGRR